MQFNIQITPELYSENVYQLHEDAINEVFRNHFEIGDANFIATYHETYENANSSKNKMIEMNKLQSMTATADIDNEGRTDQGLVTKIISNMKRQATKQRLNPRDLDAEDDDTKGKMNINMILN